VRNRNRITWMAFTLATGVGLGFAGSAYPQTRKDDPASATLAFEKLKTLVGRWEAATEKGKASATYQLVSGGTALLEHLKVPGESEMITVYYLDGNRLLLTHYCTAGNQPRMQAGTFDPTINRIDFQFLDATNLPNLDVGHMHTAVIAFHGPSKVTEDWTFYKAGKPALTVPLEYHRVD
jgi:hypothetical protein